MHEPRPGTLAIIGCSQLVTFRGPSRPRVGAEMRDLGIVEGGGMLVQDGKIASVGSRSEIECAMTTDCAVTDVGGRVVMPGFVDAHTHPVFGGNRFDDFEMRCAGASYAEIAERGGGIRSTVRQTCAASTEDLLKQAKRHSAWFLRGGTTTIEAKSGYGLTVEQELRLLRVIRQIGLDTPLRVVPTLLAAHAVPDGSSAERYASVVVGELIPAVATEGLAEYCDAFCEPGYFDVPTVRRIMTAAKRRGLKLRLHADQLSLSGGALLASELGAATADHLERVDASGIAALARAGVQPVLLPGSVYALGLKRYSPAREMIDAGLAVVLATDFNPGTSPTPSMPMAISLACTQMGMTPAEALCAATINAAWSLNRGAEIGSLEVGKWADFTVLDCEDWREIACMFGVEHACQVWMRGRLAFARPR